MLTLAVLPLLVTGVARADAPLTQGFEDGAPAWSATGMWHVQANPETISVIPAIAERLVSLPDDGQLPAAFQGVRAAWFGEAATGTYCGADFATIPQTPFDGCTSTKVESGTLTSPSISLAGQSSAVLTFSAWWEIEAVRDYLTDQMRVEYSTDGGTNWRLAGKLNPVEPGPGGGRHDSSTSGGWHSYAFALAGAAGQSDVRIRFAFDTLDRFRNGFRGLLVDNVSLVDALGAPIAAPGGAFTDAMPALSVTGAELVQTPDGGWAVHFTVGASQPTAHPVGFDWTIVGQSGTPVASGHATLDPGATQTDVSVPVSGTDAPYTVVLSNAAGASIASAAASGATGPVPSGAGAPPPGGGQPPALPPGVVAGAVPVFKKSFAVGVISGTIRYHLPGRPYVKLGPGEVTVPLGSVIDATKGHVLIVVQSDANGTLQQGELWGGKFGVFQVGNPAVAELRLAGGNWSRCGTGSRTRARAAAARAIRNLWASAKGRFRTKGRFASATVRGTKWHTQDLCTGTRVAVVRGVVAVFDFRRHRTTIVRAGHGVTITALRTGRYRNRPGTGPSKLN